MSKYAAQLAKAREQINELNEELYRVGEERDQAQQQEDQAWDENQRVFRAAQEAVKQAKNANVKQRQRLEEIQRELENEKQQVLEAKERERSAKEHLQRLVGGEEGSDIGEEERQVLIQQARETLQQAEEQHEKHMTKIAIADEKLSSENTKLKGKQDRLAELLNDIEGIIQDTMSSRSNSALEPGASSLFQNHEYFRQRLINFYSKYNPRQLAVVDETLELYLGREELFFVALVAKYGPEPTDEEVAEGIEFVGYSHVHQQQHQMQAHHGMNDRMDNMTPIDHPTPTPHGTATVGGGVMSPHHSHTPISPHSAGIPPPLHGGDVGGGGDAALMSDPAIRAKLMDLFSKFHPDLTEENVDQALSLYNGSPEDLIAEYEQKLQELRTPHEGQLSAGADAGGPNGATTLPANPLDPMGYGADTPPEQVPASLIPAFARLCQEPEYALHGTLMLRKRMEIPEPNSSVKEILQTGILPTVIEHSRVSISSAPQHTYQNGEHYPDYNFELKREACHLLVLLAFSKRFSETLINISQVSPFSYTERIEAMLRHYDPEKLASVQTRSVQYGGKERLLLESLMAKYGPEPASRIDQYDTDTFKTPKTPVKERLLEHCERYCPQLLTRLGAALRRFKGAEKDLFNAIVFHFTPDIYEQEQYQAGFRGGDHDQGNQLVPFISQQRNNNKYHQHGHHGHGSPSPRHHHSHSLHHHHQQQHRVGGPSISAAAPELLLLGSSPHKSSPGKALMLLNHSNTAGAITIANTNKINNDLATTAGNEKKAAAEVEFLSLAECRPLVNKQKRQNFATAMSPSTPAAKKKSSLSTSTSKSIGGGRGGQQQQHPTTTSKLKEEIELERMKMNTVQLEKEKLELELALQKKKFRAQQDDDAAARALLMMQQQEQQQKQQQQQRPEASLSQHQPRRSVSHPTSSSGMGMSVPNKSISSKINHNQSTVMNNNNNATSVNFNNQSYVARSMAAAPSNGTALADSRIASRIAGANKTNNNTYTAGSRNASMAYDTSNSKNNMFQNFTFSAAVTPAHTNFSMVAPSHTARSSGGNNNKSILNPALLSSNANEVRKSKDTILTQKRLGSFIQKDDKKRILTGHALDDFLKGGN